MTDPAQQHSGPEFNCVHCGYCLRGIAIDNLCPECGTPILHSLAGAGKPTSGSAVASLVLGIVSIVMCSAYGLPAIVCGPLAIFYARRARRQLEAGQVSPSSLGLARAGRICGIIGTVLGGLFVGFIVLGLIIGLIGSVVP